MKKKKATVTARNAKKAAPKKAVAKRASKKIKAKAWSTTVPLNTGTEAVDIRIDLTYKGINPGSTIALTCNNEGTTPPVHIPAFPVTEPFGIVGITVEAPANYTAELTYTLMNNPQALNSNQPTDSYVELVVSKKADVISTKAGRATPVRYVIIKEARTTN